MNIAIIVDILAEGESSTYSVLVIEIIVYILFIIQIYPHLYPQLTRSIELSYYGFLSYYYVHNNRVFYQISKLDLVFVGIFQMRGVTL